MAYQVETLDDTVAVDTDDFVSLSPQAIAMLAQLEDMVTDHQPIPGHTFSLFIRTVTLNGTQAPALWDLGCNRSLIPYDLAIRLPNAHIDGTATHQLETAGGVWRTEGTIRVRVCLTPRTCVTHTFVVSRHSGRVLIGGDILATCFGAVHFSLDGTFHLYGTGAPEIVHVDDPTAWDDQEPTAYNT